MNFTELQMELRSIEEHISQLHNEIEKMKPQIEEEKKTDFEAISRLARKHPVKNAKLTKALPDVKKTFIRGLAYLIVTEETDAYDRLLYLTRLSIGCGLDMTAEEIYKSGLEFEAADIERLCTDLMEYKYTYLVEAFIIANLSDEPAANIFSVIADVAKVMGFDKEKLRVTAQVAKAKLTNNLDILKELPVPSKNQWSNQFSEYISHDWIVEQRIELRRICTVMFKAKRTLNAELLKGMEMDETFAGQQVKKRFAGSASVKNHPCEITKRIKAGSVVKKGDVLCVYIEKEKKPPRETDFYGSILPNFYKADDSLCDETEITLTAPCNGIAFFIEDKVESEAANKKDEYISVYVTSYFDEYNDFCKWYRNGCK